jgi:hypothetical protein
VSLWWNVWQSWSTDCHFFGCEEWDRMLKFFFALGHKANFLLDLGLPESYYPPTFRAPTYSVPKLPVISHGFKQFNF